MLFFFALILFAGTQTIDDIVSDVPGFRFMGTKSPYITHSSKNVNHDHDFDHHHDDDAKKESKRQTNAEFPSSSRNNENDREPWKKFCKPVHLSYVGRHGNRHPSEKNMKTMQSFVTDVRKQFVAHQISLGADDGGQTVLKFLEEWKLHINLKEEKELNYLGYREMYELGKRFARSYRLLFTMSDYHHENENEDDADTMKHYEQEILEHILFISSSKSRCLESAKEFIKGLTFVLDMHSLLESKIEINGNLMRFHDNCTKFITMWDSDKNLKAEYKSYKKGKEIQNIASKVAQKLGLSDHITSAGEQLDRDNAGETLWSMMNACAGETAHFGKVSPWCHLLDEEDFKHLSYLSDLKHYYKNTGYIHPIGAKQSCELLQNLFHFLDQAIVGTKLKRIYKKAVLRFGHAETLIPLYSLLGLYKEPVPLTADYDKHVHRRFHLSRIVPYSANMALVLYECSEPDEPLPFTLDKYMLQLLVNEQPEVLPMCHTTLCSYAKVKNFYRDEIENCNFSELCERRLADDYSREKDEL